MNKRRKNSFNNIIVMIKILCLNSIKQNMFNKMGVKTRIRMINSIIMRNNSYMILNNI